MSRGGCWENWGYLALELTGTCSRGPSGGGQAEGLLGVKQWLCGVPMVGDGQERSSGDVGKVRYL